MPLVFLSPYKKTYSSDFCSLSTLIGFIFLILAIFIPLFAALSSEDFWLRLKEYIEQPRVECTDDYMIYITTGTGEANDKFRTFFSSSNNSLNEKLNLISEYNLTDITFLDKKLECYPTENDGINDKITLNIVIDEVNIIQSNRIDFKLMFFLKYGLTKQVKLLMTPMVYLDIPILEDGRKRIDINGDIELIQKSPIVSTTITSQIYNYEKNVFEIDENLYSPFDLLYFYNKYKNLNYTLKYDYEKTETSNSNNLEIKIGINIPKLQRVFYIESVFEAIKYAWMQYFYIFLPIYIILYIIYKFIIESNIFYSHVKSDL